jgi:pimeloyl-ACP methyl ester carboxylesterase
MRLGHKLATIAVLVGALGSAGCGSNGEASGQAGVVTYRPGVQLAARAPTAATEGPLRTEAFEYTSVDGQRVPALFSAPAKGKTLGCVIYSPGFAQPKEALPALREGLAKLRLATFSIDARNLGARGGVERARAAVKTAPGIRAMVLGTATDLRVGLDWLDRHGDCRSNIAVLGTSFGAMVATHLAAQDDRIHAAILTSVAATFKQTILMRPLAAKTVPDLSDFAGAAARDPKILDEAVKVLGPYDLERWIGLISPRPVMLINGRFDPIVAPADALQLAAAARPPKTVLYFDGGHDPFAPGPDFKTVSLAVVKFLIENLNLPIPAG